MNFPTICIRCGLAHLPWWRRGQQGRNPETAEAGSLRLEFPSGDSLSSETPRWLGPSSQLLQPPHPDLPLRPPRPHLFLPGHKHTQHMAATSGPCFQRKGAQTSPATR